VKRLTLCLAVFLLMTTGCDGSGTSRPAERPARIQDLAKAPVDLTKRCPNLHHKPLYAPEGRLPEGALSVRLCTGWVSKEYAAAAVFLHSYDDPRDVLRQGVEELADRANALKPPPPPRPGVRHYCSDVGGTPLEFWFAYPGGRAAVVRWEVGGCGYVHMGPHVGLVGGGELRDTFSRALAEQRSGQQAPRVRPPRCNPSAQPLTALEASTLPPLAAATYCALDDRGRWRAAHVPDAVLREINREAVPGHQGSGCSSNPHAWLRARTTYGDRVDLYADGCRWTLPQGFAQGGDGPPGWWSPSPRLGHQLASLPLGPPQPQRKPDGTLAGQ
jgi:hypothetical protein